MMNPVQHRTFQHYSKIPPEFMMMPQTLGSDMGYLMKRHEIQEMVVMEIQVFGLSQTKRDPLTFVRYERRYRTVIRPLFK